MDPGEKDVLAGGPYSPTGMAQCAIWGYYVGLQCFDAVGWVAGRASGL